MFVLRLGVQIKCQVMPFNLSAVLPNCWNSIVKNHLDFDGHQHNNVNLFKKEEGCRRLVHADKIKLAEKFQDSIQ